MAVASKLASLEQAGMASKASEDTQENTCVVCYKGVDIYSIGLCDHPVCYECSTRMRVLCRQKECPICRQDMPTVLFAEHVRPYAEPHNAHVLMDKKFNIVFDSEKVQKAYNILLAHTCPKCEGKTFQNFNQLREHVRRVHQLNYCDLCVENLKILTRERRCYTRQELAIHRRHGDPDDRSHRGHPQCQFCDTRFMDSDELYRHLRRYHLYCHFCDADGYNHYYGNYESLREHFRSEHYLCEEGECYDEKFTAVFRTEIDLKAHRASAHGRSIGKAGVKQARTLELEFTLAPRARVSRRNRDEDLDVGAVGGTEDPVYTQLNTDCMEEFPSLGGKVGSGPPPQPTSKLTATIRSSARSFTINDENFPALGPEASVSFHVNSERPISSVVNTKPQNLSIQVNHRPSGFTTRVSSSANHHGNFEQDFPALSGKMSTPMMNIASTQWSSGKKPETKISCVKQKSEGASKPVHNKTFHIENDFPSLSSQFNSLCTFPKENKAAKMSSASLPVPNCTTMLSSGGNAQSSDSDAVPVTAPRNKKKKSKSKATVSNGQESMKKPSNSKENEKSKKKPKDSHLNNKPHADKLTNVKSELENINNNSLCSNNNNERVEIRKDDIPGSSSSDRKKEDKAKVTDVKKEPEKLIVNNEKDFPTLGRSRPPGFSDGGRVPPGFTPPKWEVTKPPPGLEATKPMSGAPPPGFSLSNGALFPALNGRYAYSTPSDFVKRNSSLVSKLVKIVGQDKLNKFKEMSVAFRNDVLSGEEYFSRCSETMGNEAFHEIFPELLALLPDIAKQQELWPMYLKGPKSTSKKNLLEACATCGQVVKTVDLQEHLSHHALENQFSVMNGVPPGLNKVWSHKGPSCT